MVGIITLGGLGLSLSVDAFAAAVGKGSEGGSPRFRDALRIGAIFGFFEAITPAIGWAVGLALSTWIAAVDHWVAFVLLGAVGGHMLWQAYRAGPAPEDAPAKKQGIGRLVVTALATSIDATAVGVTLAFLHVNILVACLVIGGITTVVATAGVTVGKHAGAYLGRYAEVLGGLTLITIGSVILFEHLTA
ncbi:manganese efflux pump MntP family protein [Sphingomonas oligophenolica]|uniref:Putative manganese efflux pump MntP n=1 Tax=Sphingomonas oligophenolica TaxID=301154 RepID=A0ABU9Y0W6_9SPHN